MNEQNQTRYTLLRRVCDLNDGRAWEEFVEHYRRFICHILQEMGVEAGDIEDVAQQVFLSLTKDLSRYDKSRARFRTWLSAVIRNAALVYFRKRKSSRERIRIFGEEQNMEFLDQPSDIDQRIEQEWAAYVASIAMMRVRKVFKGRAVEAFELGLDGLSVTEIAEKTGLSVASVYTLRKRVKKRLYLEIRAIVAELEPS